MHLKTSIDLLQTIKNDISFQAVVNFDDNLGKYWALAEHGLANCLFWLEEINRQNEKKVKKQKGKTNCLR